MPEYTLPDGSTREFDDAGPPTGAAVLLLHDTTQQRAELGPIREALADEYRVLVPDRAHPDSPDRDAIALLAFLDQANAKPAAVVGIGTGAAAALHMAKTASGAVYRVIADSVTLAGAPEGILGDILCHCIVAWGRNDELISHTETVRAALAIPRAQRVDYECGHGVYLQLPDRFVSDVRAWLNADAPPAKLPLNEEGPVQSFDV